MPDHSAIFADDFASPKSLADYISLLDRTPELYNSYFAWRKHSLPERISNLLRTKKRNVCDFIERIKWKDELPTQLSL